MKKIGIILITFLLFASSYVCVYAEGAHPVRVVDEYGILDEVQIRDLTDRMDKISTKHNVDVALAIVASSENKSPEAYADDYFDYNGYGMGEDHDGVMLIYFVDEGENGYIHLTTHGIGIDAISDRDEEEIFDKISSNILCGNYMVAFADYADMCDELISEATTFNIGINLIISIVVGFVIAFIITSVMKGKLKSVAAKREANSYLKPGSLTITDSREMFLYRTVTFTPKASSNNSSGTHTSSSGRTHGGSGRSL